MPESEMRLAKEKTVACDLFLALGSSLVVYPAAGFLYPDPNSTRFIMAIHKEPMPDAVGFAACLSSYRRPAPDFWQTRLVSSRLLEFETWTRLHAERAPDEVVEALIESAIAEPYVRTSPQAEPITDPDELRPMLRQELIMLLDQLARWGIMHP